MRTLTAKGGSGPKFLILQFYKNYMHITLILQEIAFLKKYFFLPTAPFCYKGSHILNLIATILCSYYALRDLGSAKL